MTSGSALKPLQVVQASCALFRSICSITSTLRGAAAANTYFPSMSSKVQTLPDSIFPQCNASKNGRSGILQDLVAVIIPQSGQQVSLLMAQQWLHAVTTGQFASGIATLSEVFQASWIASEGPK